MENLEDMGVDQLDVLDVPEGAGELSLPRVVVREILENLSSTDCLNVSRVNKVWHYEALSVLRDRGSLTAKMNSAHGICKDLRAFASDLRRLKEVRKVIPFSGLTIAINGADYRHGGWCGESSAGELDPIYEDILNQMDWKHLTLDLSRHSVIGENCAGFQLVKKLLLKRSWSLEEFSLKILSNHEAKEFCIQNLTQHCNFSSLRTLKFQGAGVRGDEDLIKALVSRAPALKVLYTGCGVDVYADLLEGRSAEHVLESPLHILGHEDVPQRILRQLKLRMLVLGNLDLERLGMIPMLLRNSRTTLSFMQVDAVALVLLMHFGICVENVRKVIVLLSNSEASQARSSRLLKSFDFSRIFPNLRSVHVTYVTILDDPDDERRWNAVTHMVEQGNAEFIQPPNRTQNIKKLNLLWRPSIPVPLTRFLVQMFPHTEKLFIETRDSSLFVRFWDHWLELKELDVELKLWPGDYVGNLDSALCGIFPEEVAELREQDENYLRSVEIVPVMPSLSSFKRLRKFNLYLGGDDVVNVDATSSISKVTGLIGFRRCPKLRVTLEVFRDNWRQALQHMEPYAPVNFRRY